MNRRHTIPVLLIVMVLSAVPRLWAAKVLPMNLDRLTETAGVIFEGECIDVESGKDPDTGHMATWYTFKVHNALKGEMGDEYTFKQYGGSDGETTTVLPTSKYHEGEQVVLFLYEKSRLGFTSAVGLHQGKFHVQKFKNGERYVSNGMPGRVLLQSLKQTVPMVNTQGVRVQEAAKGDMEHIELDAFKVLIKSLIEQNQSKQAKQ